MTEYSEGDLCEVVILAMVFYSHKPMYWSEHRILAALRGRRAGSEKGVRTVAWRDTVLLQEETISPKRVIPF
jgi:hypothetical protein